jgi:DNA-binding NtrC family response regulator
MYFRNVSWDVPGNEFDLLASLKYGKRIIVTQAMDLSELCERAGVGFLQCPWTLEQAYDAMELALKTPLNPPHALGKHAPQPHRTRPPRIVVVCENAGPLESISLVIERYVKDAAIVTFDDSEKAWQELSQTDPDLLITDYLMSRLNGKEILQRLLDRKAIYPIIVVSGFENTDLLLWVRECASRGLNVTFLNLPFDIESLVKALETALKIKIPRDAATRDEIKPIKSQAKTPKRRGTLLIVDDEDGVCQCLRVVFKDEYDLFTTDNGPTAIKLAQENDIDVVVTNIHMSGMSGIELLERLKFLSPDIEVIIMTGFETMDTVRESLRLGASDYINKPFDIETIRSAVSKAMQHHALESEKTAAWKNSSNKTGNVSEQPL